MGTFGFLLGTRASDSLEGTEETDRIFAFAGDDTVDSGMSDLYDRSNADLVFAGRGDDEVLLRGFGTVFGGPGDDDIASLFGDTLLFGGKGDDTLIGGNSGDRMFGGPGADLLLASLDLEERTPKELSGGAGADTIRGAEGGDEIRGGKGPDEIDARAGNDRIVGGPHGDTLAGGEGEDRFVYRRLADSTVDDPDLIEDFAPGEDLIDVRRLGIVGLSEEGTGRTLRVEADGGETLLEAPELGLRIVLAGEHALGDGDLRFAEEPAGAPAGGLFGWLAEALA